MIDQQPMRQFLDKVEKLKKEHQWDLSSDEDLSIAVMNLVSLEEHFFFTGAKTGKGEYYDLLTQVREVRKDLLKKIVKEPEGEVWCISKHLLAASMRLIEVGTKLLNQKRKEDAEELFTKAYNLYSLFWGLNLKVVPLGDIKKKEDNELTGKLDDLVEKLIDCCKE
ncbi:MAG: hypothetical protein HZC05_02525 [Candidatus Magasanikbacteria bacterium]|nr:hypothetical protein [Candidatus Magasanikbacteria bacterium]